MTWSSSKGFQLAPLVERAHRAVLERESSSPWAQLIAVGGLLVADEIVDENQLEALRRTTPPNLLEEKYLEYADVLERSLPGLGDGFELEGTEREHAERLLSLRHELELARRAERRLGAREPLSPETLGELYAADDELRDLLPLLTALNPWRQRKLSEISPPLRQEFFWFAWGHSIPSDAYSKLDGVRSLLDTFPALGEPKAEPGVSESTSSSAEMIFEEHAQSVTRGHDRLLRVAAAAVLLLAPLVGFSLLARSNAEKAAAEKRDLQAQLEEARRASEEEVSRLKTSLADAGAMSEAQAAALRAQLEVSEKKAAGAASPAASPSATPSSAVGGKACGQKSVRCCDPGDPMCGGL